MLTHDEGKLPLKVSVRCLCLLKGVRRLDGNMALVHTHYFKSVAYKYACDLKKKKKQ